MLLTFTLTANILIQAQQNYRATYLARRMAHGYMGCMYTYANSSFSTHNKD